MPKFYVMNPPDLRDAGARARLNELIYRLEHTKYSIGRVSTNFWLWEYQRFLNDFPDVEYESGFYDQKYLSDFFSQFDYQQYRRKLCNQDILIRFFHCELISLLISRTALVVNRANSKSHVCKNVFVMT